MIKKIMAMLVAISCAFGAWADKHINGTDFSGLDTGPFTVGLDDGGQTGTTYWYNGATNDFDGTIVVEGGKNFLTFESSITNPLYRTFKSCNGASSTSTLNPTNIGDGLFIDTTVQFTPYLVNESHDAPSKLSAEDKLIVWVCETESTNNVNTTNLIVTAGYLGAGGLTSVSNYVVTTIGENALDSAMVSGLCSHTNRLTIKAFETITTEDATVAGFVVYLNEMPLGYAGDAIATGSPFYDKLKPTPGYWYGNRQLFPSLMSYDASGNPGQLSGVGYAGMGKIGDVFLDDYSTDYPEFAGDGHNFTVELGDGVTSFMYNNVVYSNNYASSVELAVDSVTISNVTYDADHGWKHKDDTWRNENDTVVNNRVDASGKDYGTFYFADGAIFTLIGFQANYIVNGAEFDNLTDALAAALAGPYTLVLNNDIIIGEGDGRCIVLNSGTLTIDLNGHTLQGTDETFATIENLGGTLTITDNSQSQTGRVLDSPGAYCLAVYDNSSTTLDAGTYENITIEIEDDEAPFTLALNGGTYYDPYYNPEAPEFYLATYLGDGKEVIDWTEVEEGFWYATVGSSGPTPPQESYFPQTAIEQEWAGRKGTAAKPFVIRNAADFAGLKGDIADGYNTDKYFEVVVDNITLTDWDGIGTNSSTRAFAGTLNGNGKTVNITFAANKTYNGLFAFVNNATISNLTVNVTAGMISGSTAGAAFVGKAYGSCTFETLKATGSLGTELAPVNHNTAGICAQVNGSGTMNFNYCTNAMNIYASYKKVGGIVATRELYDTAQINFNNCVNSGNINNSYGQLEECYGTGGLMGWTGYANPAKIAIANCSNTGNIVSPNMYLGNFLGYENAQPTASGTNIGLASLKPSGSSYITGLDWASVSGDIATFVTPVATVTDVVSYKVMQAASTPNFTLAAAAASLTIDTSLAAYTGTVSVDESLAEDYNLRETAIANGTIYSLVSKTPADPWAPADHSDTAVSNKVIEVFGEAVAEKVHDYDTYTNMVAYLEGKGVTDPDTLNTTYATEKPYVYQSYMLGAAALFTAEPEISIVSVTPTATAGQWAFNVQVTQGDSSTVLEVAAAKVAALVKVRTSLTTGSWEPPASVNADELPGGHTIQVTVSYGEAASGFMKISD